MTSTYECTYFLILVSSMHVGGEILVLCLHSIYIRTYIHMYIVVWYAPNMIFNVECRGAGVCDRVYSLRILFSLRRPFGIVSQTISCRGVGVCGR